MIESVLIANVYFPCSSRTDVKEVTLELLGQLDNVCSGHVHDDLIIGGDINCNLDVDTWS